MRILFLFVLLAVLPTTAASKAVGVVTQIRASNSTDQIIFTINGEIKEAPRCNENSTYTFSLSNAGGKAILELIKISLIEEITISVAGLNTCSRGWKSEGVQDVALSKPAR